ncbi:glycoside hydrolase family 43 protein [Fibrella aquatilis]|uniref:Glycoside hydrolase family 43 protein n=1 Tax=Fibrella aquatilis TaxID=2817059 RepID=A0A939G7M7_9BACT|nr:glycoside hydrolase family 43 protein [Fibrella aquatilis]MBO0932510.1 glycoside hydrolase family 43 protein [Fibrella aquatilis]
MKSSTLLLFACMITLSSLAQRTFTNPLKPSGPDPWVLQQGGWYYYMNTTGRDLTLWRTHNLADLAAAEKKVIFTPPTGTGYSKDIWAPEIHFLDNRWYVYFAADSANNLSHRIWALENTAADPFTGNWTVRGKVGDRDDHWAIDLSVFDFRGKRYAVWSGWEGRKNGQQDIFISQMTNPWTLKKGRRTKISSPTYEWEQHGEMSAEGVKNGEPVRILVNEGPEPLQHDGRLFVVYSANACWLDYCLGLLTYRGKGSLLKAKNWIKSPTPVFTQAPENGVYAPGHGGFFVDSKGQNWMIYHANPTATDGCGNKRAPHIQPFTWHPDGSPNFGKPVANVPMVLE